MYDSTLRPRTIRPSALVAFALVGALLAWPASGSAQDATQPDSRWLPFVGCWEAVNAEQGEGLLCFEIEANGAQLSNVVAGEVTSVELLASDGVERPVASDECEGWERVSFSDDGRRVFTETEFSCAGETPRAGTGVMAFVAPNFWVDVRALDVDGEPFAWVQEYRLVGPDRLAEVGVDDPAAGMEMSVRPARMAAARPITLEEVEEGARRMGDEALNAWVVAQDDPLDPTGDDLVRLADSGVSGEVIDAIVAVSHPDRFMVEVAGAPTEVTPTQRPTHYRGYMGFDPWWGPRLRYGHYGYGYGAGYRYGYSPFGYGSPGYGLGGYWGYRPGGVIIERRPRSTGRVVNGRGYTRGNQGARGSAQPRGGTPSYSTGSSGDRSSASAGSSSGSSRGSTGRKAKRRPPGG